MKPLKPCNSPTCRALIPFDEPYCERHLHLKRERHHRHDAAREREDKKYRRIYHNSRWRKLRKQILLRDDYLCQMCLEKDIYTKARIVDHIIELRDDLSKAYDADNLQSLCDQCHSIKTAEEREKREQKE